MQKSNIITQKEYDQLMAAGKHQAIVKEIGGCRYLIGLERSKASSKYNEKLLLAQPLNLTAVVTRHKMRKHLADLWDIDTPRPAWWRNPLLRVRIAWRIRSFVPPKVGDSDSANTPASKTVLAPKAARQ